MLARRHPGLLALVLGAAAAGCYSPTILDCSIECGTGGSCPDGTQCGRDNLCHVGALDSCNGGGVDGAVNQPDAPKTVDAPQRPDAPTTPDAPTMPDAGVCIGANIGEPDNQC